MGRLRQLFCKHDYELYLSQEGFELSASFTCRKCGKFTYYPYQVGGGTIKDLIEKYKRKCKLVRLQEMAIKNNKLFAINMLKELQLQVSEDKTNIDKLIEEKIDYLEKGESSGRKITK